MCCFIVSLPIDVEFEMDLEADGLFVIIILIWLMLEDSL
jgi:hypothetical protein